jgi:hypothetical protein
VSKETISRITDRVVAEMHDWAANVGERAAIEAHTSWAAHTAHLPHIRAQTHCWLALLGLDGNTEQDLLRAVNEAASNSIEHCGCRERCHRV